jgi:hypothetical protein
MDEGSLSKRGWQIAGGIEEIQIGEICCPEACAWSLISKAARSVGKGVRENTQAMTARRKLRVKGEFNGNKTSIRDLDSTQGWYGRTLP